MGGSAALAETPPTPAAAPAPATPAATPPTPPAADASAGGTPPAVAPTATTPDPDFGLPKGPADVPYARFKTERARLQARIRELEPFSTRAQTLEQQMAELRGQLDARTTAAQHFDALARVIRSDPELQQKIEALIGPLGDGPVGQPATANLPPKVLESLTKIEQLAAHVEQQRTIQAQQEEQRELNETLKDVDGRVTALLTDKTLPADFLHPVRAFVLNRMDQMFRAGHEPDLDAELPFLFAEWARPVLKWHNDQLTTLSNGHRADAALPASPGGAAPGTAALPAHANDDTTSKLALAQLRAAGWAG